MVQFKKVNAKITDDVRRRFDDAPRVNVDGPSNHVSNPTGGERCTTQERRSTVTVPFRDKRGNESSFVVETVKLKNQKPRNCPGLSNFGMTTTVSIKVPDAKNKKEQNPLGMRISCEQENMKSCEDPYVVKVGHFTSDTGPEELAIRGLNGSIEIYTISTKGEPARKQRKP